MATRKRTKSVADIMAQRNRIQAEIIRRSNGDNNLARSNNPNLIRLGLTTLDENESNRYRRVNEISGRYFRNISKAKGYRDSFNKEKDLYDKEIALSRQGFDAERAGDKAKRDALFSQARALEDREDAMREKRDGKQYSQRTYMGASVG